MKTWSYFTNPFLVIGSRNLKEAVALSTFTYGFLSGNQADAFWGPLYTFYKPLHDALVAEYNAWTTQRGTQKGSTTSLDVLLEKLSNEKINAWDLAVQFAGIPKGSGAYVAIFPQGHKPFQTGDKDSKINAVGALGGALTGIVALAALKLEVDNYFASLENARTLQNANISGTGTGSDDAKAAMVVAMTGLYKILGSGIAQFSADATVLEPTFDMQLLRSHEQTLKTGTVTALEDKNIFKRTLEGTKKAKLIVLSDKALDFYVADEKNDKPGTKKVTVQGLEEEIVEINTMRDVDTATYFKVYNPDGTVDGHFTIELL